MNYHGLFKNDGAPQIRVALVGVGDFGATLLDQSRNIDKIEINVICDKDETRMKDAIRNSGIKPPPMMVTDITADGLPPFDVVVEATGQPGAAAAVTEWAIDNGCHVIMASKEAGIIVGPIMTLSSKKTTRSVGRNTATSIQECSTFGSVMTAIGKVLLKKEMPLLPMQNTQRAPFLIFVSLAWWPTVPAFSLTEPLFMRRC